MKSRAAKGIIFIIALVALAAVACNSAGATSTPPSSTATTTPPASTPAASTPISGNTAPQGPAMTEVNAPIEGVELVIFESDPLQYVLRIVTGLPGGCAEFNGFETSIDGNTITIVATNLVPTGPVACTADYRYHEGEAALGTDFTSGETYSVIVNGQTMETFTAQ